MSTIPKIEFKPIRDRKIRVGLVGCGRISKNHFESFNTYKDEIEVVAVCDTDETALQQAVELSKAKGWANLPDMLENEKLDLIVLTTPSGLHPEQAILAAKAGCHVVSEKPMATNIDDAKEMVHACEEARVRLFVVKQNRHNATLQLLKRAIDEKRFGQIYMVSLNVFWHRPQSYYDQALWRGTWQYDGGAYMNQASHYMDLLSWLFGPVSDIHAFTGTLARKIEAEDTGVVSLRWRSGAIGSVNVTMLTYPKNLEGSITVLGETGTVRIGGMAVNEIQTWDFAEVKPEDQEILSANYQTTSVYGLGHPHYYRNVIETLRGDSEPYTDGYEGLKSLELICAAYVSAKEGRQVTLPLTSER